MVKGILLLLVRNQQIQNMMKVSIYLRCSEVSTTPDSKFVSNLSSNWKDD